MDILNTVGLIDIRNTWPDRLIHSGCVLFLSRKGIDKASN